MYQNRTIVECKYSIPDVNGDYDNIRIEPQWNVNYWESTTATAGEAIRIEPQWNVNDEVIGYNGADPSDQNRTIVECKFINLIPSFLAPFIRIEPQWNVNSEWLRCSSGDELYQNRTIVECK